MKAYFLCSEDKELENFAKGFGYSASAFLGKGFSFVDTKEKKQVQKELRLAEKKKQDVILKVYAEEDFRHFLEKSKIKYFFGMELMHPKDSMHYPRSGIDQVSAELAKKGKKVFLFDINTLNLLASKKRKAQALRRIKYALKFCKKYKVEYHLVSFAKKKEDLVACDELASLEKVLLKA